MTLTNKSEPPINITGDLHQINFSIDNFKDIRSENFLYVDKSKLIEDILNFDKRKVILFTRPRRFGKSLNLSMLRYFFDMTEDSRDLFKDLYIEKSDVFEKYLNQYPILWLNFKDVNINSEKSIHQTIVDILESEIDTLYNIYQFNELKELNFSDENGYVRVNKIKEITKILNQKTGKKVIILMDEYDSLLNQTYGTQYWHEIAKLTKKLFGSLLKSNDHLEMGVLTGVSRVGKELGFSDLNNLSVYGMTKEFYYEYFGFTENEVKEILDRNKIEINNDFYQMYNGYHLNNSPYIFNTVSILKFLDDYHKTGDLMLSPYWINSATNTILKDNIKKMDIKFRNKLLNLLDGNTIVEGLYENIDYGSLHKPSHMFSLLIDTGYLSPIMKMGGDLFKIKIPNSEVLYGYKDMVNSIVGTDGELLDNLCYSLINENIQDFENILNNILMQVSSFNDFSERENSYHCLMEGALLYMLGKYKVRSNREAGLGRFDICLIPMDIFKDMYKPIIIEFKVARESYTEKEYSDDELLVLANNAIAQIEDMKYYEEYRDEYSKEEFIIIGIGAQGKRCRVAFDNINN